MERFLTLATPKPVISSSPSSFFAFFQYLLHFPVASPLLVVTTPFSLFDPSFLAHGSLTKGGSPGPSPPPIQNVRVPAFYGAFSFSALHVFPSAVNPRYYFSLRLFLSICNLRLSTPAMPLPDHSCSVASATVSFSLYHSCFSPRSVPFFRQTAHFTQRVVLTPPDYKNSAH